MQAIRSILWIGPEAGLVRTGLLDAAHFDITWIREAEAIATLPCASFDACVLGFEQAAASEAALRRLRPHPGLPPLLVLARSHDVDRLRQAIAFGAGEVLAWEADPQSPARFERELYARVEALVHARRGVARGHASAASKPAARHGIIGESEALRAALDLAERAAGGVATILLHGETGTGKEIFARAIHRMSARSKQRFVAINCAAIPDSLLESELFGHVRGAFTGANTTKAGLFELARGGTLFLDEVGETSGSLQAKLLRALQEKEIRPVGGNQSRKVDVRIVAASNRDLRVEAARGTFREDLFYRLAVFPITIPALRKRGADVIALARHFLARYGHASEPEPPAELSQAAAELLLTYPWPGNVRELENEMQRALTLAGDAKLITPELLSEPIRSVAAPIGSEEHIGRTLREIVAQVEAQVIRRTLANNGGRKARSARDLGITREGLYKKMKRLGIG